MKITWDEPKRMANILNHGIDFAAIEVSFFGSATILPAKKGRSQAIWWLGGMIISVIFQPLGAEGLSIISARPASRNERSVVK
jgi:uncharacterized DUF497 family protein